MENDYDTPVVYGLSSYERVEGTYIVEDGDTVNSGFIRDNSNPKIEVRNHRGFGLRVEKEWSDADFMLSHDDIYVGIFVNGVLLEGSVHSIDSYNYTTYYFETLEEGAALDDYEVREVEQTEDGWVAVDTVSVGGKDKDGNSVTPNSYSVSVTKGGPVSSYGGDPNIIHVQADLRSARPTWQAQHLPELILPFRQQTAASWALILPVMTAE